VKRTKPLGYCGSERRLPMFATVAFFASEYGASLGGMQDVGWVVAGLYTPEERGA
jgi:hypothetical protein